MRTAVGVCAVLVAWSAHAAPTVPTDAFFGDLHVHTGWSFDAYTGGTTATPEDAYRFARGEPLRHAGGATYRLDRPLDFLAVTDHAEFMGVVMQMRNPESPVADLAVARHALDPDPVIARGAMRAIGNAFRSGDLSVFEDRQEEVGRIVAATWSRAVELANRHNDPGRFTTLIGYEWTASSENRNLHRNVLYRGDAAPLPFTAVDSPRPEDLWRYLDEARAAGHAVLAIPHNSNLSDGAMFADVDSNGVALTASYAATRARNEPLVEITQVKGTSETHPLLSADDEFAGHELMETYVASDRPVTQFAGSYVRDAWRTGLTLEATRGFNPFRFGVVGASDAHVAMSTVIEHDYSGKSGVRDATPEARLDCTYCAGSTDLSKMSAAGLTGVWAAANTRAAIYDALARNEVFATTGPRLRVRFFGGPALAGLDPDAPQWVTEAYRRGVPMGATLPPGANGKPPHFLVSASKDPDGANLDRIQIIKVWSRGAASGERIFDVALSDGRTVDKATGKAPAVGNTVDARRASYTNTIGAATLSARWTDPDFDPIAPAAYYVRVLEIPTPRWSTFDAARLGRDIPIHLPASIQERAFTSPIWYAPPAIGEGS